MKYVHGIVEATSSREIGTLSFVIRKPGVSAFQRQPLLQVVGTAPAVVCSLSG